MLEILESVIFIDAVKFPPFVRVVAMWLLCGHDTYYYYYGVQDSYMSDFVSRLFDKTAELFPSLLLDDLIPFLLNSRAVSAYDAVMLLANSATSASQAYMSDHLNGCLMVHVCMLV